jgi:hypothetical protein
MIIIPIASAVARRGECASLHILLLAVADPEFSKFAENSHSSLLLGVCLQAQYEVSQERKRQLTPCVATCPRRGERVFLRVDGARFCLGC